MNVPPAAPGTDLVVYPSDSVSVVAERAQANTATIQPAAWCLGPSNCPWCMLQCSHAEHGDLAAAGRKVLSAKAQALGISDEGRSSIAATTGQCLMMGLVACSQHLKAEAPGEATEKVLEALQMQGLLPPLVGGAPSRAAPAASKSDGGSSVGTDKEKPAKFSWDDPPDAAWRQGDWIKHSPQQERLIHVFRGKRRGWVNLPEETTQVLLQWYDTAKLFDVIKGVSCVLDGKEEFLTYRYEGGQYLTEQNPNQSQDRRECVVYKGKGLA